jgi:hypothetical protein
MNPGFGGQKGRVSLALFFVVISSTLDYLKSLSAECLCQGTAVTSMFHVRSFLAKLIPYLYYNIPD